MVVALLLKPKTQDPRRFYGSALPRPRFYTDVKLNPERVDPPASVMDPFLSWARDAHWSMGGLSFERHRLQGRIEGSIKKLRAQQEDRLTQVRTPPASKARNPKVSEEVLDLLDSESSESEEEGENQHQESAAAAAAAAVDSPPAESLYRRKKRAKVAESPSKTETLHQRKRARKLGDVFDRIASEQMDAISSRTRSSRNPAAAVKPAAEKEAQAVGSAPAARRTSPRKKVVV